jgi:hypothetical protein
MHIRQSTKQHLAHQSFLLFALAVMVIVLCITYIGIHQIAAVGALAMQLNPAELGMSNIGLAMLLLLTWSISTALSPFSGLNLMVSQFAGYFWVSGGAPFQWTSSNARCTNWNCYYLRYWIRCFIKTAFTHHQCVKAVFILGEALQSIRR